MKHLLLALILVAPAAHADPQTCVGRTDWRITPGADGTPAAARELATWLALYPDADRELLTPGQIQALNVRNADTIGAWHDPLMERQPSDAAVKAELDERLGEIGERVKTGEYVEDQPGAFAQLPQVIGRSYAVDEVRFVTRVTDMRCLPLASGFFRGKIDHLFDRNQCSRLHPGELVRVLRRSPDDLWVYGRAGHGVGWVDPSALSPRLSLDEARALRDERPRLTIIEDWVPAWRADGELALLRFGTGFPLVGETASDYQVLIPTETGFDDAFISKARGVTEGYLPLTRRSFLGILFAHLGNPYGWGGTGSGRDCSALLLDTSATYDLRLGRNSSIQGISGWQEQDLSQLSEADKLQAMRAANQRGVVFLYMPGHIMVYLGDLDGRPYAISAISEYLMPCAGGGSRTVRLDRVEVTDLERGRDTERTAYIQRISHLSVFGP